MFLILCINNIDILSMCMKKCHAKNCFFCLLNNCFSNLVILHAFVFLILVFSIENCGGYLISIAYCPFFIIVKCHHNLRKYSILETVRFFLRSVYLSIRLHFEQNNQIKITDKVMYIRFCIWLFGVWDI